MADAFRERLAYEFRRPELLRQALTHRSFGVPHNERLEFIGDAVLGFVVALALFERFPQEPEGQLSRLRAHLVNRETLARLARQIDLANEIRLGKGATKGAGDQRWILADTLEAVFGAVYLDGGIDAARRVIDRVYAETLRDASPATLGKDPKTRLQEWLQARRMAVPEYVVAETTGDAHAQQFEVECRIPALALTTRGSGASRRAAEQDAASRAFDAANAGTAHA
jgi:ribonuclease-3